MTESRCDVAVIGAGIVGLSVALHITQRFPRLRVVVLEKEAGVARHQSGHNSGVIHAGIYYKPGSLKARLCVEGAAAMVEFCRRHNLPHNVCGKLIVATSADEVPRLQQLRERGEANGLRGLRLLDAAAMRDVEPHAAGLFALHVPGTGITDYQLVSEKYAELIRTRGGTILTDAKVSGIRRSASEVALETTRGTITAAAAINCAGLYSDRLAAVAGDRPDTTIVPFRGEYYVLAKEREELVRGLIYPVPDPRFPFLGVHFTLRVHGGVEAGPNAVLALRREGYKHHQISLAELAGTFAFPGFWRLAARNWRYGAGEFYRSLNKTAFVSALQKLVPEIRDTDLRPGGSGVRAQALERDGSLVDDFRFVPARNMLHVLNVPSPAATASLPIGRAIVDMAAEAFGWSLPTKVP
jgi:L-2-hydroxyglutarate oxidase LhgO